MRSVARRETEHPMCRHHDVKMREAGKKKRARVKIIFYSVVEKSLGQFIKKVHYVPFIMQLMFPYWHLYVEIIFVPGKKQFDKIISSPH
jgi:hypothetical protein